MVYTAEPGRIDADRLAVVTVLGIQLIHWSAMAALIQLIATLAVAMTARICRSAVRAPQ